MTGVGGGEHMGVSGVPEMFCFLTCVVIMWVFTIIVC